MKTNVMTHKTALIIDPEWRLQPPPVDLQQYQAHVKTELGKLPPTDFLMTAVSRDDEYFIANMFHDGSQQIHNSNYPSNSIPSPHFPTLKARGLSFNRWSRTSWLNHKIMSNKFTELDKKTKQYTRIATAIPINTASGLINANAGNDAILRMLNNTKHKIDQIVIVDPYSRITNTFAYKLSPNGITPAAMFEVITAWSYALVHPHIPRAVIV